MLTSELTVAARPALRRIRDLSRRCGSALRNRLRDDPRSDREFIEHAYRLTLNRPADSSGRRTCRELLSSGMTRDQLLVLLATSEESINRRLAEAFVIQDLQELRPDRYRLAPRLDGSGSVLVFAAEGPDDFDWLERAILGYGYYEKPGIWTLGVDEDKRRMAELLALFAPARALEIGCSSGAVLGCLHDRGVHAEGIEISAMAVQRASADIRQRIHVGDLLNLDLEDPYELVYGLDIFEHFNPGRIDEYIGAAAAATSEAGMVFANLPTWGDDRVYGTLWSPYLQSWVDDINANRLFEEIEVDRQGYPLHGHLIWAGSRWWEERFAAAGLLREVEIERALHRRFDAAFDATPARKAFYVFSKAADRLRIDGLLRAIIGT